MGTRTNLVQLPFVSLIALCAVPLSELLSTPVTAVADPTQADGGLVSADGSLKAGCAQDALDSARLFRFLIERRTTVIHDAGTC